MDLIFNISNVFKRKKKKNQKFNIFLLNLGIFKMKYKLKLFEYVNRLTNHIKELKLSN